MFVILQVKGRMTLKALQRSQGCPPTIGPGASLFPPWFQRAGRGALAEKRAWKVGHQPQRIILDPELARVSVLLFYQVQNDQKTEQWFLLEGGCVSLFRSL